jgi:hypothetical protein
MAFGPIRVLEKDLRTNRQQSSAIPTYNFFGSGSAGLGLRRIDYGLFLVVICKDAKKACYFQNFTTHHFRISRDSPVQGLLNALKNAASGFNEYRYRNLCDDRATDGDIEAGPFTMGKLDEIGKAGSFPTPPRSLKIEYFLFFYL